MSTQGMGRGLLVLLVAAGLWSPPPLGAARIGVDPARFSLAYLRSDQKQWFWAAAIEQTLRYYGLEVKQEEMVKRVYGLNPDGSTRTNIGDQTAITETLKHLTVDDQGRSFKAAAIYWQSAPTAQVLQAELSARRPILAVLKLPENVQYKSGNNAIAACDVVIIDAGDYAPDPDGTPRFNSVELRDPSITWYNPKDAGFQSLTPADIKKKILSYWTIRVTR